MASNSEALYATPMVQDFPAQRTRAERQMIDLVMRSGELSLKDVTARSDFTQQYVSKLSGALVDEGVLNVTGRVRSGRGQPSISVKVNGDHAFAVGASLMTDALSFALIDLAGRVRAERHFRLDAASLDAICGQLGTGIDHMCKDADVPRDRLVGLGLAVTGYFIGDGRKVNPPPALADIALQDLEPVFAEALDMPVIIDNDGNTAAAGEGLIGVGRWAPTFAYIFMSAGLGGGVVVDGKPFRGAHGNAGEFANIIRRDEYYPTLETLRGSMCEAGADFDTIEDMLSVFAPDLPGVDAWVERAVPPLSRFVSAISACFDPHAIVLGGRLPRALAEALIPRLDIYNADRRGHPKPIAKIVPAEASGDAAACGAALMPLSQVYYTG